ncbi:MAG: protein phosphatase CheZ, partial [Rhodospirillaceae bacterium]
MTTEPGAQRPLNDVLGKVESMMTDCNSPAAVYLELKHLAEFIQDTKTEIAALRPDVVKSEYLPTAADELDAIVAATAQATNTIMDAVDSISAAGNSPEITDAVTKIYEACTFQDITGQRITKVIKVLKVIEERIDRLLIAVGGSEPLSLSALDAASSAGVDQDSIDALFGTAEQDRSDARLLNGPQLPGNAT